jgi:TonB family protein
MSAAEDIATRGRIEPRSDRCPREGRSCGYHRDPSVRPARTSLRCFVYSGLVCAGLVCATAQAFADDHAPRLRQAPTVTLPADGTFPAEASVRLEITVDAEGAVTDATVLEGLRPDVDARVLDAARQMRFEPAERGGVAVPARLRFRFRLRNAIGAPSSASTPESAVPPNPYAEGSASTAEPPPVATPTAPPTPSQAPAVSPPETSPTPTTAPTPSAPEEGGEATVRTRRQPGAATVMTLRAEELTTVPGTFGEPTRVVATMPGVSRTPFGLGLFVVRGASFENTGFFIDGFPVPVLYHFGFGPAVISSRLVGELNFYPGGYPLTYGRFSAGVISLDTRPPPTDRPFAEFQVDVLRASAMGVMPFDNGRGSVAVAARRSYYDLIVPLIVSGVGLSYSDYQVRSDYRFSSRSRASVFLFGSNDTFDRTAAAGVGATAQEQSSGLSYTFHRLIAKYEHSLPGGAMLTVSGMAGVDFLSSTQTQPGQADRSLGSTGFILGERTMLRIPTGRVLTTLIGLDVLTITYDADVRIPLPNNIGGVPPPAFDPEVVRFNPRVTQLGVALVAEESLRLDRVELTAGARLDRLVYGNVNTFIADPRAVLRVRASDAVTITAASGFFHQAPPFVQLVPGIGNPDLKPQRSWQSSLGVELSLPGNFEARFTGYFNRMYNLQRPTSAVVDSPQGPRRLFFADDGQGRSYGLEVLLRRRLERGVYGWVSYTLSRSERFLDGGNVVPFTFDQTHVLNIALSWQITPKWRLGGRFQLTTGNPTQSVTGAFFDADTDRHRPLFAPQDPNSPQERLPTYHQLDVRVDYRFRAGPFDMSAYLDVINVYYAQNTEAWLYQYDFARRTNFPGVPILPTLGITGELR